MFQIQPTTEEDSGTYMCESSDQHGSTYKHTFTVSFVLGAVSSGYYRFFTTADII